MSTAQAQAKQREQLALYTKEELEQETVLSLREMAKGLFPLSKLTKKKLIDSIIQATQAERQLLEIQLQLQQANKQEVKNISKQVREGFVEDVGIWIQSFYQSFRKVALDKSSKEKKYADLASLAHRLSLFLERPKEDGDIRAATTIARERSRIVKALREMVQSEKVGIQYKLLASALEEMEGQLSIALADISEHKRGLQERVLAERKEIRDLNPENATLSFRPLINFANETLVYLEGRSSRNWKEVVIALAIATGRRPAEIQSTDSNFELVTNKEVEQFNSQFPFLALDAPSNRLVRFTGQMKEKGLAQIFYELHPSYLIPTLVTAPLVVAGYQWLVDNDKVVDSAERANKRYSKELSQTMRGLRRVWGIDNDKLTAKGLRAVYAQVCNHLYNQSNPDNVLFFAKVLGHGRSELIVKTKQGWKIKSAARLTDMLTPQSYNSDFVVVDWEFLETNPKIGS